MISIFEKRIVCRNKDWLWNIILGILLLFSVHDSLLVSNIFGSSSRSLHVGLWSSVDFRQKSNSNPAASNKEFPNKQKWRKAERGIKDGIDFGLRTRELRKAMEERTIIGELMIFQKYINVLNYIFTRFSPSLIHIIKDNLLFPHNLHSV